MRQGGARSGEADEGGAPSHRLWLPLNALRAFEAVGKERSFTAAATALHVSQSSLSRHVGKLEELLGRRLLERRPTGVALTPAGTQLLAAVKASFDRIEQTIATLLREDGPRVLSVHMPPTFLAVHGLALLRDFRTAFPDVVIDVSSSNGIGWPRTRSHDVAVVFDRPVVDDVVRDLLWTVKVVPACAPEVAARAGGSLAAFLDREELLHIKLEGEPFGSLWADFARRSGIEVAARRGLAFETEALAVQCAVAGGGVVLVDRTMWRHEVAAGRLVMPFPDERDTEFGYYMALRSDDLHDPAVALLRTFVIARFVGAGPAAAS